MKAILVLMLLYLFSCAHKVNDADYKGKNTKAGLKQKISLSSSLDQWESSIKAGVEQCKNKDSRVGKFECARNFVKDSGLGHESYLLGRIYKLEKNNYLALYYFFKSLNEEKLLDVKYLSYIEIAEIQYSCGKTSKAISYLKESLKINPTLNAQKKALYAYALTRQIDLMKVLYAEINLKLNESSDYLDQLLLSNAEVMQDQCQAALDRIGKINENVVDNNPMLIFLKLQCMHRLKKPSLEIRKINEKLSLTPRYAVYTKSIESELINEQ